ncbi:MAG: DUF1844 domain-containing protein [Thermodesulfobacteriota bacterium]
MEESERNEGFRITDKRRFTSEGEAREEQQAQPESTAARTEMKADEGRQEPPKKEREERAGKHQPPPPLDFSTFVLSLANTALLQLGLIRLPNSQEGSKDIAGARQTIDILGILEEKTRGNLNEQEKKLLSETLFQLRMAFVEATR